jgi:serine/threonine protein kinase
MGGEPSIMAAVELGMPGFVPQTHQQAVVYLRALGVMRGEKICSLEPYRPYSVGTNPPPSARPPPVTHTPPGSPVEKNLSFSCRSKDAPSVSEYHSLRNDYEIERELGASSEGTVYLGRHKKSGEVVALKSLKRRAPSRNIRDLPQDCLLSLDAIRFHRNILFLSQIDIVKNHMIWQCLSFCNAGDLINYLERANERALTHEARLIFNLHVFIQLGEALAFLHHGLIRNDRGRWTVHEDYPGPILHNDVKPDNVMLHFSSTNDMSMPDIRLGDFGNATWGYKPNHCAGTPIYFSPEALNAKRGIAGPKMQMASDVYTFGLTMYQLITDRLWVPGKAATNLSLPEAYEYLGFDRVLQHCLKLDPKERPTMNRHSVSGLMHCVDHAYKARAEHHAKEGHIAFFFWKNWHSDALEAEKGT